MPIRSILLPAREVEVQIVDAMEAIVSENGVEYVAEYIGTDACLTHVSVNYAIRHYGVDEVLSCIDDEDIEAEYLRRSPLGKVMAET